MAATRNPGLQIGVVAKPGVLPALAVAWQSYAGGGSLRTKIFSTMFEARAWLDPPDADIKFAGT